MSASSNKSLKFFDASGNPINNSTQKEDKSYVSGLQAEVAKPTNVSIFEPVSQHAHLHQHKGVTTVAPAHRAVGTTYTTQASRPVPFYPPDLEKTLPKWDSDKADPEQNWVITSIPESHKNKDPKAILADPSIGVVFFTPKVMNELQYAVNRLADKTGECAMFVLLRQLSNNEGLHNRKPHYLAYDWFMPKQTASSGEVKLDVADCTRYFEHFLEKYPEEFPDRATLHRNLMHAHSHHRMNLCAWSGTDHTQQTTRDELAFYGLYRLFFLFTIGHGLKCTMVSYVPHLSKTDYAIGLCYSEPEYVVSLTKARKKELDDQMDALVSKTYSTTTTYAPYWQQKATTYPATRATTQPAATPVSTPASPAHGSIWDDEMYDEYTGAYHHRYQQEAHTPAITAKNSVFASNKKDDIFSLLPTGRKSIYAKNLEKTCELLTLELKETNDGWASSYGDINIPEAIIDKVASSIDIHQVINDLLPVPGSYLYTQLDEKIALSIIQSSVDSYMSTLWEEVTEVDDEGNVFVFRDQDGVELQGTTGETIDWDTLVVETIDYALLAIENIGTSIAELSALASLGKELDDIFLTQLYNESYIENLYDASDIEALNTAIATNGVGCTASEIIEKYGL